MHCFSEISEAQAKIYELGNLLSKLQGFAQNGSSSQNGGGTTSDSLEVSDNAE